MSSQRYLQDLSQRRNPDLVWLWGSLVVVAVGVVFLLDAFSAVTATSVLKHAWPFAIILGGLLALAERPDELVRWALPVGAGVVAVLFTTNVLAAPAWDYIWPAAVLAVGIALAVRWYDRRAARRPREDGIRPRPFHIGRRMVLLAGANKAGDIIEWMCTGGRPAFLMLALAAASLLWLDWWAVLVLYTVLLLVWFAAKAKSRVVIETFEDHTTGPAPAREAAKELESSERTSAHRLDTTGMAGLLATQLAEMRNIYHLLEEPLGRPRPGPVEGAVQLEDIGDVLRSAFTSQTNVTVGTITLPFGGLMALLGRLVQAPRLHGAIYGDDRDLTLTASLAMHGHDYVWNVARGIGESGSPPLEGEQPPKTPTEARGQMIHELAYRVFTDLSLLGQAEWPATMHWLDALRERKACQRSPQDRRVHLEQAEARLREALAADERFYLAAYNLGIVYRQLADEDANDKRTAALRGVPEEPHTRSALKVFGYAIDKLDHGRWEAYYGLALAHWRLAERKVGDLERRRRRIIDLCDRALGLPSGRAARAQVRDLKAMAQRRLGRQGAALETWHEACDGILGELALAQIWRVPSADVQRVERLSRQASQCLLNLAIAYDAVEPTGASGLRRGNWVKQWSRERRFDRIYGLARAAEKLADLDAEAHASIATIAYRRGHPDLAVEAINRAIRVDPNKPLYWARKAELCAEIHHPDAEVACAEAERAIDFSSDKDGDAIEHLIAAHRARGVASAVGATTFRRDLGIEITQALKSDEAPRRLRELLVCCRTLQFNWEAAIVERHLGEVLLNGRTRADVEEAERLFAYATARLAGTDYAANIRRWGLPGLRARAIASQWDRTEEALKLAEDGVAIDPLSADAWRALAIVREHGRDYDCACTAWEHVRQIKPGNPDDRVRLARCQWEWAQRVPSAEERASKHHDARENLHAALQAYDSSQREERRRAEWWTAQCHWMLGEFGEMPPHLLFILGSIESLDPSPETLALNALLELTLAQSYRQTRRFAESEAMAGAAIADATNARRQGFAPSAFPGALLRDEHLSLDAVEALARAELAGSQADRGAIEDATRQNLDAAEALLLDLPNAQAAELRSEILTERGRIELVQQHAKDAVNLLERAVGIDPGKAGTYVALARANARLTFDEDDAHAAVRREKARECCRRAKEIVDASHPQWQAADEVEHQLAAFERPSPAPAVHVAIDADGQPAVGGVGQGAGRA